MNVGLYSGSASMAASEQRLQAITSNLANVGVTGFKRTASAQHGVDEGSRGGENVQVQSRTAIDWSQGPLERTGVSTDLALMGAGFFAVEGPDGELYTRDGHFQVHDSGQLVTQEGYPAAWSGPRGVIDPTGAGLTVDRSGGVWQDDRPVGRLTVVDFPARDRLVQTRDGYFQASAALARLPADAEVHQGALEGANVNPVDEMVALIQTHRAFQRSAQVVELVSKSYERLNNQSR